jgi:hypothetical protein
MCHLQGWWNPQKQTEKSHVRPKLNQTSTTHIKLSKQQSKNPSPSPNGMRYDNQREHAQLVCNTDTGNRGSGPSILFPLFFLFWWEADEIFLFWTSPNSFFPTPETGQTSTKQPPIF